jgi:DNA-binding NarL/FixJ family response regulator
MTDGILFVDDEPSVLSGYQRLLQRHFRISIANGGDEGLSTIEKDGPFAVVVSDMRMPGMNGAEFLGHVRLRTPDTVRMLLTGYTDVDAAIEAVNKGNIFRYLTKPCQKDLLLEAVNLALAQYHSVLRDKAIIARAQLAGNVSSDWDPKISMDELANPAGLPGPSQAKAQLLRLTNREQDLHVVLLRFSIADHMDSRRAENHSTECLRVSAGFLQRTLAAGDQVYAWDRGVLMLILRRRGSPTAVNTEIDGLISGIHACLPDEIANFTHQMPTVTFEILTIPQMLQIAVAERLEFHSERS